MRRPRKSPPAKERYDLKRPVVSVRVSAKQLEKLNDLIKGTGMSKGRFIRRALDLGLEKKDLIYRKGYREGYEKAKDKYTMHLFCDECGDPIPIHGPDAEILVSHAISQTFRVYHKNCQPTKAPGKRLIIDKYDNKVWIEEA